MIRRLLTSPSWLMLWFALGLGLSYAYSSGWLKEFREHPMICVSNLTVNYVIVFGLAGYMGGKIGVKLAKRLHLRVSQGVAQTVGAIGVVFLFLLWLKLWGYDISFM